MIWMLLSEYVKGPLSPSQSCIYAIDSYMCQRIDILEKRLISYASVKRMPHDFGPSRLSIATYSQDCTMFLRVIVMHTRR